MTQFLVYAALHGGLRSTPIRQVQTFVPGAVLDVPGSPRVIGLPGHTPGSMSFHFPAENLLLAGDTLFRGSIGRTDLWGGDFEAIERSIRDRLYRLDETTRVITGHGPETLIGIERESNAFIRA